MLALRNSVKLQGSGMLTKWTKPLSHHGPLPRYHSWERLVLPMQGMLERTGLEAKVLQCHVVVRAQFCLSQDLISVPARSQPITLEWWVVVELLACSQSYLCFPQCLPFWKVNEFYLIICSCLLDSLLVKIF